MKNKSDVQIGAILEIADRMIAVSEEGFVSCDDDGCLLLNGMVRECAYRLRDAAERERHVHGTPKNQNIRRAGGTMAGKRPSKVKGGAP